MWPGRYTLLLERGQQISSSRARVAVAAKAKADPQPSQASKIDWLDTWPQPLN